MKRTLVQPEASSHPICRKRSSELASEGCTRVNKSRVRLIGRKSWKCSPQAGQDFLRGVLAVTAVLALCSSAAPGLALDKRYPDWPCKQLKVPVLSPAAIWAGPPIDTVGNAWEEAPGLPDLVARLAARRTPMAEAEKEIAKYLTGTAEEKQEKAKLLFAGLLETLNSQRTQVMNGLERAYRKQKQFAVSIREEADKVSQLQELIDPGSVPG